jgi:hypothetical protein
MKKSEIEKPEFTIGEDVNDPISNSMITQNNQNKSNEPDNLLINENPSEDPDNNSTFDPFAHILEG